MNNRITPIIQNIPIIQNTQNIPSTPKTLITPITPIKTMKHLCLFFIVLTLTSCFKPKVKEAEQEESKDYSSFYDQGNTSACWIYAMCACIEREQLRMGDSIALSRQWLLARGMEEHTRRLYWMHRQGYEMTPPTADPRMGFTMRGVGPEAIRLIKEYGLVPYSHEKTHIINDRATIRRLTTIANNAATPQQLDEQLYDLLPQFTVARHTYGSQSPSFFYYSMRYTPQQFAESIMYHQNWQFYASEEHYPWGSSFALETPDNYRYHQYTNMPMDSIVIKVTSSLKQGHPVYWEYGKHGRTSDHAMAIVGITHDKKTDELLFVCQNSYGIKWGKHGKCAVPLSYFRKHTSNVGLVTPVE